MGRQPLPQEFTERAPKNSFNFYSMTKNIYDLIIIGGGPAAITAGIYGARKKLKILVLAERPSWKLNSAPIIENYPGFNSISGPELLKRMREQLNYYKVGEKEEKVDRVKITGEGVFEVGAGKNKYLAKTVIVASGGGLKTLGVPGEKEFTGKGVSYCVTCDGPLFFGKNVAVIGGGNAGMETALELLNYANKIYILEITDRFWGDEANQEKLRKSRKAEFILNARTQEIKGEKFVKSLVFENKKTKKIKELSVDGVFVEIGSAFRSDFVKDLVELNEFGEIIVDSKTGETKTPGLFAAGDVTDIPYKQIIIAAGEGAKAALSAYHYLFKRT